MTKTLKLPELEVHCHAYSSTSVHWQAGDRRYHIWINDAGELTDEILHSNPIVPSKKYGVNEHRSLDATSKKWAPLVEAILARVKADDLVGKARAAAKEKARLEAEEVRRQANERALAVLAKACALLPRDLANAIAALPEADRLAFVATLENF